jgi:hypothetical protein
MCCYGANSTLKVKDKDFKIRTSNAVEIKVPVSSFEGTKMPTLKLVTSEPLLAMELAVFSATTAYTTSENIPKDALTLEY